MKKVLFATTAIVAFAGAAHAAEVKLGGDARVGVKWVDGAADETFVTNRFTLNVDASATADNGLEVGARVRFRQDTDTVRLSGGPAATAGDDGMNGMRFHMRAGGFEVAAGNIYGAMDSMPGLYAGSVGLTGLGWGNVVTNFASHTYSSRGAGLGPEGVELTYSVGSVDLHLSHAADRTELVAAFSFGDWTIGAGVADQDDTDGMTDWVLTAGGNLGNVGVGLALADIDGSLTATLSGSFKVGAATTIKAYIANDETRVDESAFGIGVVHDLGGNVTLEGGIASVHGTDQADVGVKFKF